MPHAADIAWNRPDTSKKNVKLAILEKPQQRPCSFKSRNWSELDKKKKNKLRVPAVSRGKSRMYTRASSPRFKSGRRSRQDSLGECDCHNVYKGFKILVLVRKNYSTYTTKSTTVPAYLFCLSNDCRSSLLSFLHVYIFSTWVVSLIRNFINCINDDRRYSWNDDLEFTFRKANDGHVYLFIS